MTSPLEILWYSFLGVACVIALVNPRRGVFAGVLFDVLRDPVRKLVPDQPLTITLSCVAIWLIVIGKVAFTRRDQLRNLYRSYPALRTAFHLLLLALFPAAGISIVSYSRGWLMALIGAGSYLIPVVGILAGFALFSAEKEIGRLLRWYVIVNAIMLVSVPLEYFKVAVPALGGIDAVWIRYRTGYVVNLMCGWYRSPDIMGLHAAHVIMFSIVLAIRSMERRQPAWLAFSLWAAFCLLVSGRRKMIGIPLIFVAVFLLLAMAFRVTRIRRLVGTVAVGATLGGGILLFVVAPDEYTSYTEYALTLFTEGGGRANELIVNSTITTLRQSGVIGAGLGTATQGRHYSQVSTGRSNRGWQEDGVSRLFLEFGVAGVILLCCSLLLLIRCIRKSLRIVPRRSREQVMVMALVGVVVGDAASYAISHQQFSGDPVSALLVTLVIGMILRLSLTQPSMTKTQPKVVSALVREPARLV